MQGQGSGVRDVFVCGVRSGGDLEGWFLPAQATYAHTSTDLVHCDVLRLATRSRQRKKLRFRDVVHQPA